MDAKEYFKEKKGITVSASRGVGTKYTAIDLTRFAEEFATHRTQQEAQERYDKAKSFAWKINKLDPNTFDQTLMIASGLDGERKEGEG